ncbi:MAG: pyruvoyl-dependent arginine decarboxylase [Patescibacteria group bacterium]
MNIQVTIGKGLGPTELAAFDQALVKAGVANFNLIYLSSVLPPDAKVIVRSKPKPIDGNWGDRLYVVMAQKRTSRPNQEAWAGIGWIQDPETKQGLLVEHEGNSENEVRDDIKHSLDALCRNRKMKFGEQHMKVVGIKCQDQPVCALVVAVFESTSWRANRLSQKLSNLKLERKSRR